MLRHSHAKTTSANHRLETKLETRTESYTSPPPTPCPIPALVGYRIEEHSILLLSSSNLAMFCSRFATITPQHFTKKKASDRSVSSLHARLFRVRICLPHAVIYRNSGHEVRGYFSTTKTATWFGEGALRREKRAKKGGTSPSQGSIRPSSRGQLPHELS